MDFTPHAKLRSRKSDNDSREAIVTDADEWIDNHHPFSALLMPHSLLIFKDDAYSGKFVSVIASTNIFKY